MSILSMIDKKNQVDRLKLLEPKAVDRRRGETWSASVWEKSKLTLKKKKLKIKINSNWTPAQLTVGLHSSTVKVDLNIY